jgi:tripartite-type tricarboxylate transporter receptor subunit TctC
MEIQRRQFLHFVAGASTLPAASRIARAQTYPSRPITMLVPFPAGGGTDAVARTIADHMRTSLGQTVIIENAAGANGSIGVGRVARAAGDGYTLVTGGWDTFVANGAVYALRYNLLNDFSPITLVATQPLLIVAKKVVPVNDLKDFVAWLKDNQDNASAGTAGVGSVNHVAAIYFQNRTDTRFGLVPYRGGAPALQDLVAGQIDLIISPAADAIELIRAGTIKALAVMAKNRLAGAPSIPNVSEAGFPGLEFSQWYAFFAPKNTPQEVITKLNTAVAGALADSRVRERLADLGQDIPPRDQQTPEALAAFQKAEIEKWWPIIKAAGHQGRMSRCD